MLAIINRIVPGLNIKTAATSDYHRKRRDTTTFAEMHRIPQGGFIIDTPGIKGFGLVDIPKDELNHHFPEMFRIHQGLNRTDSRAASIDVMKRVKIPGAAERFKDYPHQFSGGMRQRIMIAMMIALKPSVLIADEPTTALDVTVQSQIMDLLQELKEETNMGLILITHDLGVVADVAERILVMYAGRTMERGSVDEIYANTANPYTYGLLQSIPKIDSRSTRLPAIKGLPPSLYGVPDGCAFNPRCPKATDQCRVGDPPELVEVALDHLSRCWFAEEVLAHGIE